MEKEKRPTTSEKIIGAGFAGQLVIIGSALAAGELNLGENIREVLANVLVGVHLILDAVIVVGIGGLHVEGRRGIANIRYPHNSKKNE